MGVGIKVAFNLPYSRIMFQFQSYDTSVDRINFAFNLAWEGRGALGRRLSFWSGCVSASFWERFRALEGEVFQGA